MDRAHTDKNRDKVLSTNASRHILSSAVEKDKDKEGDREPDRRGGKIKGSPQNHLVDLQVCSCI